MSARDVLDKAMTLKLPFPVRDLSPNARVHWRKRAAVVAAFREECGWTAVTDYPKSSWNGDWPLRAPVEATVTFVVPDRRRRDLDNLCAMLKPAWDGLVDAGVLAGDDHTQFKVVDANVIVRNKQNACVVVELQSLGDSGKVRETKNPRRAAGA